MNARYIVKPVALSCALLFASCVAGQAQITKTPAGYVFKRKFAPGMKIGFSVTMQMSMKGLPKNMMGGMPSDSKVTTGMTFAVKEVQGDSAKVTVVTDATMLNGKQQQPGQTQEITMAISSGNLSKNNDFLKIIFPQTPIKEGEKYTLGGDKESPKCQFIGLKTVNGKQAALIVMNFARKEGGKGEGDMSVNATATALVDVTDGWPLSLTVRAGMNGKQKENSFNGSFTTNLTRKP